MSQHGAPQGGAPATGGAGGAPGGGAGGAAGGASSSRSPAAILMRHMQNENAMEYFAAGVCGLLGVFIISHLARRAYQWGTRSQEKSFLRAAATPIVVVSRLIRNVGIRPLPGFTSFGHSMTIATYVAINAAVSFTNVDLTSMGTIAARFGWMITANLCVLVFLALRNTPLSFLIGYSYERLNVLHQAAGYTTVMFTVLHGVLYTVQFMAGGRAELLRRPSDVAGIVSGFAMAVMFIMPTLLKGSRYEVFYISHVTSFIVIIITAALHQRELAQKVAIMTIVAGALWASDRLVRAGRTIFNARGNTARLYPLPSGGTRVVLARTPACAVAGQHCFLWIPAARKLETHPFSIVTTTPNLEFVVSCRDGFTKSLRALAVEQPGVELRASMDGPYGTFPDPLAFDRVVLIAGGNGASFAFGVLSSMLGKMADHHVTEIEFTWAVRERAHLRWYESHLEAIRNHARASKVDLTLHITRDMEDSEGSKSDKHLEAGEKPLEPTTTAKSTEANEKALEANEKTLEANEAAFSHVERVGDAAERSSQRSTTKVGRPEIKSVIQLAASRAAPHQRVLVMACGPKGLMKDVRNSVAANLHPGGPSLELHCEQFGW